MGLSFIRALRTDTYSLAFSLSRRQTKFYYFTVCELHHRFRPRMSFPVVIYHPHKMATYRAQKIQEGIKTARLTS